MNLSKPNYWIKEHGYFYAARILPRKNSKGKKAIEFDWNVNVNRKPIKDPKTDLKIINYAFFVDTCFFGRASLDNGKFGESHTDTGKHTAYDRLRRYTNPHPAHDPLIDEIHKAGGGKLYIRLAELGTATYPSGKEEPRWEDVQKLEDEHVQLFEQAKGYRPKFNPVGR